MDCESPYGFFLEKAGGLQLTELWETRSAPADNSGAGDAAEHERRIAPVGGGTVFRIIEYPPDSVRLKTLAPDSFFPEMGAQAADKAQRRHPGMHKTNTVDYAIVLSGEIYAVLDEGSCVIAFVLVAAKPVP